MVKTHNIYKYRGGNIALSIALTVCLFPGCDTLYDNADSDPLCHFGDCLSNSDPSLLTPIDRLYSMQDSYFTSWASFKTECVYVCVYMHVWMCLCCLCILVLHVSGLLGSKLWLLQCTVKKIFLCRLYLLWFVCNKLGERLLFSKMCILYWQNSI